MTVNRDTPRLSPKELLDAYAQGVSTLWNLRLRSHDDGSLRHTQVIEAYHRMGQLLYALARFRACELSGGHGYSADSADLSSQAATALQQVGSGASQLLFYAEAFYYF